MDRCKVRPALFPFSKQPPELLSRLSIIIISHPTDNHHYRQIPTHRLPRSRPLRARRPARKDGPGCRRLLPAERPQRARPAAQGGRHAQGQNGTEWKGCPEINRKIRLWVIDFDVSLSASLLRFWAQSSLSSSRNPRRDAAVYDAIMFPRPRRALYFLGPNAVLRYTRLAHFGG